MRRICLLRHRALSTLAALTLILAIIAGLFPTSTAQAQQRERCFEQTGYCVRGAILEYWEQNGGLPVFGYPISDLRTETIEDTWTGPVQWFERDRLEDHGINGILAGRLGAYQLEQQGYNWWDSFQQAAATPQGCRYFEQTGQFLCEPFLSYWQNSGGEARFGFPITAAFEGEVGDWSGLVQYFERRRMEYHTSADGSSSEILLGHLGREVLEQPGAATVCATPVPEELHESFDRVPFRPSLGCPGQVYWNVPAAVQPFQRGRMLWVDLGEQGRTIFALSTMPNIFQRSYEDISMSAADMAAQGTQSLNPAYEPPPGLLLPQHGFGRVWEEDARLRDTLGWATAPEQADQATVQRLEHGWLVWIQGLDAFYAFGAEPTSLITFKRPALTPAAPGSPALLAGEPAPKIKGELVVQTQSVDFYRQPGGLTVGEVLAISSAVEEAIASGSTMMGNNLKGRVSVRFEPEQQGVCAIRGLTLSAQRTIRMFYAPGSNLHNIETILAHEFIHQLQHDYYGVPAHLRSDIILLEGMAMWGSSPYTLNDQDEPYYHDVVQQALAANTLLPMTTSLEADCRTSTRNTIYEQWASFTEYLLLTYGREQFDAVYANSAGRPAGSARYQAVYGKSLAELEAEWQTWLAGR